MSLSTLTKYIQDEVHSVFAKLEQNARSQVIEDAGDIEGWDNVNPDGKMVINYDLFYIIIISLNI